MIEPVKMMPCPFCEGPPCVFVRDYETQASVDLDRPQTEFFDENYEAHVWCHDCGAQGPDIDSCTLCIFEDKIDLTAMDVARIAVERWNDRSAKARDCYDAGEAEGLNLFPRSAA